MGFEQKDGRYDSVFSKKVRAGKRRTYFFDVRQTRGNDYYLTITESTRRFEGNGHSRHKIFLYKEDFNRFVEALNESVEHVKTELLPDYDYDEYARRYREDEEGEYENATPSSPIKEELSEEKGSFDLDTEFEESSLSDLDEDLKW